MDRRWNKASIWISRILELPELIDDKGRILTGQRAQRRTVERELRARAAAIRTELLRDEIYRTDCKNREEREAYYEHQLHNDEAWSRLSKRQEQLAVAIDKSSHEKEVLDHERKALKAALEGLYSRIIEDSQLEQLLATSVGIRPMTTA